jgi:hypothetical protein
MGADQEPAPVHCRVLQTVTDVPLKAGRLVASASTKLIIATARQQNQRRRTERDFDDGEHVRDRGSGDQQWRRAKGGVCGAPTPVLFRLSLHRRRG